MIKSKRAEGGLYVLFALLIVGLIWITGLSTLVTTAGNVAIVQGATGIDAWFYSNLNLLIGFAWLVAIAVTVKYGF